jgi:hypothetical protein
MRAEKGREAEQVVLCCHAKNFRGPSLYYWKQRSSNTHLNAGVKVEIPGGTAKGR